MIDCYCPAHRELVLCVCRCDHTSDRMAQWQARAERDDTPEARLAAAYRSRVHGAEAGGRYLRPYDGAEMRDEPPRPASTRAEGGRFDGITDLTRLTDGSVMCCLCFEYTPPDQLWRDTRGQPWDMCQPCGDREGTPEFMGERLPEEDEPCRPSADTS